ncbi:MAG TPA: alginate lyase family protein [Candidatus Aquilonibacter sp.]|nr:alginate lyase family protein [Candidatus Aquilonibacter sp.]
MTAAEIIWRLKSSTKLPVDWLHSIKPPRTAEPTWKPLDLASYPVCLHEGGSAINEIRVFDHSFPIGFAFDWHRDYRDSQQIAATFSGRLNIRDVSAVGDIKYVWEPSRHQYLVILAFASDADRHVEYIVGSINSWLTANSYLKGVHWTSTLELAVRIISWSLLHPRIAQRVAEDEEFRSRWHKSIYLHLKRIAATLSLHSSANNHLIGELVGLYVGASCFDFWPECIRWRELATELLEREIRLQVGNDGVNREQAMSYHLFTLELLLLAFTVGRTVGVPFSKGYAERLKAMAQFVVTVATPAGDLPRYGDSDDARGFLFSYDETALEVTTQLAGLMFGESSWLCFRPSLTMAARALLPDMTPSFTPGKAPETAAPELFEDAGLACGRTYDNNVRFLMDFGPHGFNSIAAHGHADALSIWVAIGDEYFLVDAGTYAYHSYPEWRNFFRGTSAHNTVRIDALDQSEIKGRFLWGAKAAGRLLRLDSKADRVIIEADHDGYSRLPDPVIHRRSVDFDRYTGSIRLEDNFQCLGVHVSELFFHFHEDTQVVKTGDSDLELIWRGHTIRLASFGCNARYEVVSGSDNPILGWRSRQFNQKQPISTLRIAAEIVGSSTIHTHLDIIL